MSEAPRVPECPNCDSPVAGKYCWNCGQWQDVTPPLCPNCQTAITGEYCARCGQHQADVRISVGNLFRDVLEDQLSVDSTLPCTLKLLFFKPGQLTREYVQLHLARFVPPFRLYLLASVLFFLSLSMLSRIAGRDLPTGASADSLRAVVDSARAAEAAGSGRGVAAPAPGRVGVSINPVQPRWADSADIHLGNDRLNDAVRERLTYFQNMPAGEAVQTFVRSFLNQAPTVMFILLPIYALLLKLLYVRKDHYYAEHFVFALHVHAFTFSLLFFWLALRWIPYVTPVVIFWLPLHTLFAMKRFYGQGWIKTFIKWTLLGSTYFCAVCMGLIVGFGLAIMLA